MKLSDQQFGGLGEWQRDRFVEQVCADLTRQFPEHAAGLGPVGLRAEVEAGVDLATAHDLTSGRDVYLYICLMARFGPGFDRDPALPWAARILASPWLGGPSERLRRLVDTALACDQQTGRPAVPPVPPRWPPFDPAQRGA